MSSLQICPHFIGFDDDVTPGELTNAELKTEELNLLCDLVAASTLYEGKQIQELRKKLVASVSTPDNINFTLYDLKMCFDITFRNATSPSSQCATKLRRAIQHSTNVAQLVKWNKNSRFVF